MPDSRKYFADSAFVLVLMIYVLVGVASVPFHADEFMQMSMGRDVFYLLHGDWNTLAYHPPLLMDTEPYLRLINGTLNKDMIGLTWVFTGRNAESLPKIYAWAMPLDWNQAQGNVPSDDDLHLARWGSALCTALGVIPMFMLGWHLRLRSLAYPAALLYALHPVILLNGRRAMMEGSLMLFMLLTMYWLLANIVAEHSTNAHGFMPRLPIALRYGVLGVLVGLTVAAKYTGLVVAVAALVSALAAFLARDRSWRPFAWVGLAGLIALLTWFILSPGYWNDPVGAIRATLTARVELLNQQTTDDRLAYHTIGDRLRGLTVEPFLTPPQFFEAPTWVGVIDNQIAAYQDSSVDGWDWGPLIGGLLTLLAIVGLAALIWDAVHRDLIAWAILIWAGVTIASSLTIPLAWQRYYLPLLLVTIVLAAAGIGRLIVRRTENK
jgi:4-amino-4-deoxy-L-arabinose transferase-like glycosyltransferase